MIKDAWPSELKKKQLRKQGIVAVSRVANRLLVLLIFMLLLATGTKDLFALISYEKLLSTETAKAPELFSEVFTELLRVSGILCALCVAVLAIVTLLQSRFLFAPALLKVDVRRLWDWSRLRLSAGFIKVIFSISLAALLAICILYVQLPKLLVLFNRESLEVMQGILQYCKPAALLWLVLGLSAVVAIAFSKGLFLVKHRMTREEVLAESRGR